MVLDFWKANDLPAHVIPVAKGKHPSVRLEAGGCKRLLRITTFFIPLLAGKKKRAAELVKKFIDLRFAIGGSDPYGEEEFAIVNELRWQVNDGRIFKRHVKPSETTRPVSQVEALG